MNHKIKNGCWFALIMAMHCKPMSVATVANSGQAMMPPAIIYKTRKNYDDKVPITLDKTKTKIVSYPDPRDVRESAMPTPLLNGYLLDNRGVSVNSVFLKTTYSEYANMQRPSQEWLLSNIIDKNPFSEMYDCGTAYRHSAEELNKIIAAKQLKNCKRLK